MMIWSQDQRKNAGMFGKILYLGALRIFTGLFRNIACQYTERYPYTVYKWTIANCVFGHVAVGSQFGSGGGCPIVSDSNPFHPNQGAQSSQLTGRRELC